MIKLCEPEVPIKYSVNCFTCKCKICGNIFEVIFPNGDDILKLEEIDGDDVRWLPIYGQGGYLDLLAGLMPEYDLNDKITMKVSRIFMDRLQKYSEKGINGNGFKISYRKGECTNCKSKDVIVFSEKIFENPKLSWLKTSCDL
jgi:hypothetical protein